MKKLALLSIIAMLYASCASKPKVTDKIEKADDLQKVVNTVSNAFSIAKSEIEDDKTKLKLKTADVTFSATTSKAFSGGLTIVVSANGEFKRENNQTIKYSLVGTDTKGLAPDSDAINLAKIITTAAKTFISLTVPESLGLKKDSFEIELEIVITRSGDGGIEITLFDALDLTAKAAYEKAVGHTITLTFEIK